MRLCPNCGSEVIPSMHGGPKKIYCSSRCRYHAANIRSPRHPVKQEYRHIPWFAAGLSVGLLLIVLFTAPVKQIETVVIQTAIPLSCPVPTIQLSCPVPTIQPTQIPLTCAEPIIYARHISPLGIEFIKQWETLKQAMYNDAPGPLGRCTIGWGHLISPYPCSSNSWPSYISIAQADIYLLQDIDIAEFALFKMDINLNQSQYDSVIDLLYNLGEDNFKSTGLKYLLLSGDYDEFTNAVKLTCGDSNGVVWQGLINRRNAEANLFLTGNYKSLPK